MFARGGAFVTFTITQAVSASPKLSTILYLKLVVPWNELFGVKTILLPTIAALPPDTVPIILVKVIILPASGSLSLFNTAIVLGVLEGVEAVSKLAKGALFGIGVQGKGIS